MLSSITGSNLKDSDYDMEFSNNLDYFVLYNPQPYMPIPPIMLKAFKNLRLSQDCFSEEYMEIEDDIINEAIPIEENLA